ncbi:YdhK family protein [Micrococcus luteus]|uniref:YdhK family protein n=1 Tax=Micrococcales TaxID=85006 RepID=UPI0011AB1DCE|nr:MULTISPECIES: YdhK family protein [Micrococcales]MCS6711293.1 YdhK family protein [Brachybacterium sillae]
MNKRLATLATMGVIGGAVLLAGCATSDPLADPSPTQSQEASGGHGDMDHPTDGGPVPEGMTDATDPAYPVGTEVILTADHMDGMNGARATVVGAYDTYAYSVDYTPTTGGAPVTDHKWVVHEELGGVEDARLPDGSTVTLAADHMDGMNGAEATIASSTDETVYVVDYEADGMTMTNHKWVTESEMQPTS